MGEITVYRFAPSSDPSLSIKFYERTPEQQALLGYLVDSSQIEGTRDVASAGEAAGVSDEVRREPHGSVGAAAGHRAIAQSNSAEIAEALFRYTAPEEVADPELNITEVWFILLIQCRNTDCSWQVMTFPSTCGACAARCETRMFVTSILLTSSILHLKYFFRVCDTFLPKRD